MMNSHGCFAWYELLTTDMEAAKTFYTNVVGWGTRDASKPGIAYTLFTDGETSVCGMMRMPEGTSKIGAKTSWIGYVSVNDVDATADRVAHLGGTVRVPPMNIPDIGRFSLVADPQRATLGLLQRPNPGQQQPAGPDTPGRVGWHELLAVDWEKAFAFYSEIFGWQKADADIGPLGTYQLFSAGSQPIGGMCNKRSMLPNPFWLYYFNTEDIDAAAKRVKAGNGHILHGPIEVLRGSWIIQCKDPQGVMFALVGTRRSGNI